MPRLLAVMGGALCALAAAPGAALAAECPVPVTTKAFAQFGDANEYVLAPGGDFELLSWTKVGFVSLELGNDPFGLAPGVRALKLNHAGEAATSAAFCVDRTMPHMRFVARGAGPLNVTVAVNLPSGGTVTTTGHVSSADHQWWAPSRFVQLNTSSIPEGQSGSAKITFESQGDWRIDNVFLDPYRR